MYSIMGLSDSNLDLKLNYYQINTIYYTTTGVYTDFVFANRIV